MATHTTQEKTPVLDAADEEQVRDLAIRQVERKHRFATRAFSALVASLLLIVIWAISEYNNAAGWPTGGFSQSSGIPHVWNDWIIYPLVGLAVFVALDAWNTYVRKPISETEIQREMERLRGPRS